MNKDNLTRIIVAVLYAASVFYTTHDTMTRIAAILVPIIVFFIVRFQNKNNKNNKNNTKNVNKLVGLAILLIAVMFLVYGKTDLENSNKAAKVKKAVTTNETNNEPKKNSQDISTQSEILEKETKSEESSTNNEKHQLYEIARVVDGDTLKVYIDGKKETIRLLNVNTPESVAEEEYRNVPLGKTASSFTKNFLDGHKVYLEYDIEKLDQYGRTLAFVYTEDGDCLNKALIESSLAKVVKFEPNVTRYDEYKKIEKRVKQNKQGIWANYEAAFPKKPEN